MRIPASQLVALTAAIVAGCGGEDPVVVASKNFTEQLILGEIVAQELEARGVPVERRLHLGGTFVCHTALVEGEADVYVEYTGTAYTAILEHPPISDPDSVLLAVESEYAERWDLAWGPPLGFENTFALVVRAADADAVARALARPEVASALVADPKLLELDLPELTYG